MSKDSDWKLILIVLSYATVMAVLAYVVWTMPCPVHGVAGCL